MISTLALRDFRCFSRLTCEFHPEATYIIGKNAMGKTSLLEAVAVLARLQSPRLNSLQPVLKNGARGLVLDGYVSGSHLQFYYSPSRRKLALDSVEQKDAKAYLQTARVVFFGNSDIDLVRGGSEGRRRFLDFVGSQLDSSYREILRSYERALRSRNAYLKMSPVRSREIAAYTGPLLKYGHQLTTLRARVLERLEPFALAAFNQISDQAEAFALHYEAGATDDFAAALSATLEEEQRLRTTVVGPHRDDMQFVVHGQPAELFGSEGQQRTMALAIKLGQARLLETEFDQPPILLLDDVFGELDRERRNRLLQALAGRSQRIVTTTTLDWLSGSFNGFRYELRESGDCERVLVSLPTN